MRGFYASFWLSHHFYYAGANGGPQARANALKKKYGQKLQFGFMNSLRHPPSWMNTIREDRELFLSENDRDQIQFAFEKLMASG